MITIISNLKLNCSLTNSVNTYSKNRKKDPILEAIEKIILSKSITKKELKGEKLSHDEENFKNQNLIVPDLDTILLELLETNDYNKHNYRIITNNTTDKLRLLEISK